MSKLSNLWHDILSAIVSAFTWGKPKQEPTNPQPDPVDPQPEPEPEPQECMCDLTKPLVEPQKGEECPVPWGMDIRFLGWSPSRNDWIFIGCNDGAIVQNGKQLTGRCFQKAGKQYHYIGYRAPSSASQLIRERTGTYKETYRLYFECRR